MPTTVPPEVRQKILSNNRSLRNIKNELENLFGADVITSNQYDQFVNLLPQESPLNGPAPNARNNVNSATASLSNLSVTDNNPPPPTYNSTGTPSLPPRAPSATPAGTPSATEAAPFVPDYPEVGRALAQYEYNEPGDCNFKASDQISIREFTNAEWWYGTNIRTRSEGVFPKAYVNLLANNNSQHASTPAVNTYSNEKANYNGTPGYNGGYQQPSPYQGQPQYPPPTQNPYNSAVPPMQVAEQPVETQPGKGSEMGKKIGKKFGNAAIFGAGATVGGNLVNSIF